ncbi:hypothetical protein G5C60_42705 [Streptomyces sp. HC44]|uniref:Uncharacterized protein n=1 Tax=Streptomyces scabichelini TaxID=2711217 RepID=A0A6G4VJH9_9ACTN|nr:hypothetical protein [Streptomyces scabichelini]NGO14131.1 hypothetical protein [Streptomyces scabichelini]
MRVRTAVLVLRLRATPDSRLGRPALRAVLRAADSGSPVALRAVARAVETHGQEAVFRSWLTPSVSGPSPQRWASPLVAGLPEGATPVPAMLADAAWHDWLDDHDAGLWSLLERWGPAPTASGTRVRSLSRLALGDDDIPLEPRTLVDAALRFDHPIGARARARLLAPGDPEAADLFCAAALNSPEAAAFCAEHHLAPAGQVQRAVFFVRTAQLEQYRALDPDGSLLALGYRGVSDEERTALRDTMSGLGILDVLRVLAGQGSQQGNFTSLAEHERAYLVEQLADRRDWDRLWSLTPLMPLPEAVRTAHEFGDWRPSGEDDRRVFEALRGADWNAVTKFVDSLAGAGSLNSLPRTRIWPTDPDEQSIAVHALDFAPDGTQLAFAGRGPGHCAGIVDLGSLTLVWLDDDFPHPAQRIAHLGSDAMVAVNRKQIHYADENGTRALDISPGVFHDVQRIAGDRAFIVPALDRRPGMPSKGTVFVGASDGPLTDSGIPPKMWLFRPRNSAVDAEGRLIALVGDSSDMVVADLANSAVNRLRRPGTMKYGILQAAISPSALVAGAESGGLHVWHEPLTTSQTPITTRPWTYGRDVVCLAWSPALERFLAVTKTHLQLLDVPPTRDTLMPGDPVSEQVPLLADSPRARARCARVSSRGDLLAVGGLDKGTVDIYVLTALTLRPFIADPMGVMSHKDLTKVVAVMENPVLNDLSRQALGLLRTCLEHRFRHDVGLGGTDPITAGGPHDIALGEHQERERASRTRPASGT